MASSVKHSEGKAKEGPGLELMYLNSDEMREGDVWVIYPNIPQGPQKLLKDVAVQFLPLYAVPEESWTFCSISKESITTCQELFERHRYACHHKGGAIYFPKGKTLMVIPSSEKVLVVTQPGITTLSALCNRIAKKKVKKITMSSLD